MTIKDFLYIKTIMDEKSVSKASKKLFVAQPALSRIIKRIEDFYEIKLFNRIGNKILPTEAGIEYYKMATQIINITDNFRIGISDLNQLYTGKIRIGTTNFIGAAILSKILPVFYNEYPNVEISVRETNSGELENELLTGELDMILMPALDEYINEKINYDIVSKDDFLVLTAKTNPINKFAQKIPNKKYPELDLKLLTNEHFIMVHKVQRTRQVTDVILKKANITNPKILYTLKNFSTIQSIIANGIGVALMPKRYLNNGVDSELLSCFSINESYNAYWNLSIATNKSMILSLATRTFIKMLKEYIN